MFPTNRPQPTDYDPFFETYVSKVPEGACSALLDSQEAELRSALGGLSPDQASFRYAPGKWSIREVVGHVTDTERIFGYRLLRIARGDATPLPGFEQDDYVKTAGAERRPLDELLDEFGAVRRSNLLLVRSLDAASWERRGVANHRDISALALAYLMTGHVRHHQQVLAERYLAAVGRD